MTYEYKTEYNKNNDIKLPPKNTKDSTLKFDSKNYIGQLNENTLLKYVLVIQSHNSGCSDQVYAEKGPVVKWGAKILGNIPGKFANCQTLSLKDQFNAGVRAFDIRVKKFQEDWYFEHGLTISKNPINSEINGLVEAAEQNPKELIFVFLKSTSGESIKNSDWYKSLQKHCFKPDGKKLCQHSIKDIRNSNKNIILIANGSNPDYDSVWCESEFDGYWSGTACGSDDRDLKINYFKDIINIHSNENKMFGIKIPNTTEKAKLKKFLKFAQNKTSVFPLKDAKEVTYNDSKEIIDWIKNNDKRLNFIAVDGVGTDSVKSAIRYIGEFNLKRNKQLYK